MGILKVNSLKTLESFIHKPEQLAIYSRQKPAQADAFFEKLMQSPFGIAGEVSAATARDDICYILEDEIPKDLQNDPFYDDWIDDMARLSQVFCVMEKSDAISFWIGSQRGCRRYHIDNVPKRLLVTYAGQGTEWLPDEAADRIAYANGEPNEKIVKDPTSKQFISSWDVAIFRGGPLGLLHRTPDEALNGPSILMRLDHQKFWRRVQQTETVVMSE